MKRSIDLLLFWVSSYYAVDFLASTNLVSTLVNFLQEEVPRPFMTITSVLTLALSLHFTPLLAQYTDICMFYECSLIQATNNISVWQ